MNIIDAIERQARQITHSTVEYKPSGAQLLAVTGLLGEFGEVMTAKKTTYEEELGDFLWYVHLMCLQVGVKFLNIINSGLCDKGFYTFKQAVFSLCAVSEIFKKVAVTKQKPLTAEMSNAIAVHMVRAASVAFGKVPPNADMDYVCKILIRNIEKLEKRHGRNYE